MPCRSTGRTGQLLADRIWSVPKQVGSWVTTQRRVDIGARLQRVHVLEFLIPGRRPPIDSTWSRLPKAVIEAVYVPAIVIGIVGFDDQSAARLPHDGGRESAPPCWNRWGCLKQDFGGATADASRAGDRDERDSQQRSRQACAARLVMLTDGQAHDEQRTLDSFK